MVNTIVEVLCLLIIIYVIYKYYKISNICSKGRKIYDSTLSGCEIGNKILENNSLDNIYIVETDNPFDEGYNSNRKVIKLQKKIFNGDSVTDGILVARECSYAILDKNNKYNINKLLYNAINIMMYISYTGIILCSLLKDLYYLRISLIILICSILVNLLFYNFEKRCSEIAIAELESINYINEDNKDIINNINHELSFKRIVLPITLIINLIRFLINKDK